MVSVRSSVRDTQGRSRVPELGPLGSMRGASSNGRPYREHSSESPGLQGETANFSPSACRIGKAHPARRARIQQLRRACERPASRSAILETGGNARARKL